MTTRSITVGFLTIAMSAMLTVSGTATFAETDFPPEQHLARGYFHTAVFSRNAKLLLTPAYRDVQLWDVETGALIRQFAGHEATIHSIVFSPDEKLILTAAGNSGLFGPDDASARVWDVATGKQLAVLALADDDQNYVLSAQFLPDGKDVLTVSVDQTGSLTHLGVCWKIASRQKQFVLSGISVYSEATNWFDPIRMSPGGDMLAGLADDSRRISVWNGRTGGVLWQVRGEPDDSQPKDRNAFGSLQFSPNGKILLGVCSDMTVRTWSSRSGQELQVFRGHKVRINVATFCHEGERVMTASTDGTARLWETASGRQIKRYDHPGPIREMVVNSVSTRMATRWSLPAKDPAELDRQWFTSLWDTTSGREIKRLQMPLRRMPHMVFSPDGERILVARADSTFLLDAATGQIIRRYE